MAGTWGERSDRCLWPYSGDSLDMFAVAREFTADASAATVPDWDLKDIPSAFLVDLGVVFDGVTPPDTLTVTVKDIDGLTVFEESGITASARVVVADRPSIIKGCVVAISANTTVSAKAKVILNFASNKR
jgi:hypothetical protein